MATGQRRAQEDRQINPRQAAEALHALSKAGEFAARVARTDADPAIAKAALQLVVAAERFAVALSSAVEDGGTEADSLVG